MSYAVSQSFRTVPSHTTCQEPSYVWSCRAETRYLAVSAACTRSLEATRSNALLAIHPFSIWKSNAYQTISDIRALRSCRVVHYEFSQTRLEEVDHDHAIHSRNYYSPGLLLDRLELGEFDEPSTCLSDSIPGAVPDIEYSPSYLFHVEAVLVSRATMMTVTINNPTFCLTADSYDLGCICRVSAVLKPSESSQLHLFWRTGFSSDPTAPSHFNQTRTTI